MQIYAGQRNVTEQFYNFFDTNVNLGTSLNGSFQNGAEEESYLRAVEIIHDYFAPSDGSVSERFEARFAGYAAFIEGDCETDGDVDALVVGFYEEVMEFIESGEFDEISVRDQNAVIGLASELIIQLWSRGVERPADSSGGGTSTETSAYNPITENFRANIELQISVTDFVPFIGEDILRDTDCAGGYDGGLDGSNYSRFNPYGRRDDDDHWPNAFTLEALNYKNQTTIINLDYRYPRVTELSLEEAAPAEPAQEPTPRRRLPLGGNFTGQQ